MQLYFFIIKIQLFDPTRTSIFKDFGAQTAPRTKKIAYRYEKIRCGQKYFLAHYILYFVQALQFLRKSAHYSSRENSHKIISTCRFGTAFCSRPWIMVEFSLQKALQLLEQNHFKSRLGELETRSRCLRGVERATGAWIHQKTSLGVPRTHFQHPKYISATPGRHFRFGQS